MKLVSVLIEQSSSCGGLLDGFELRLRETFQNQTIGFSPMCLVGANGTGKSQFLQTLAEMLQLAWHACAPDEERRTTDQTLAFTLEYLIWPADSEDPTHVRVKKEKNQSVVQIETKRNDDWHAHALDDKATQALLPSRVIGYTSGENETFSLPFFNSRAGYAEEVTTRALPAKKTKGPNKDTAEPKEPRLMLIDYGTHLEVLVANLLLGSEEQRDSILSVANLSKLRSVRCVVQLANRNKMSRGPAKQSGRRKGVQLTDELECYIEQLQSCSTCWHYDQNREIYTFDYWCDEQTRLAFETFFEGAFELYRALHKLALLNDLAISRPARRRFNKDVKSQRFAARLPEPPDEDKIFRFEQVTFVAKSRDNTVDYVSLSDGEHQLAEIMGVFAMVGERNVVFLLDEPESHFNPQWRVAFMSNLRRVPTPFGDRQQQGDAAVQDVVLTTHAPFVPSDMPRENVLIFERAGKSVSARTPDIQTFGASFEEILEHCFRVEPPISELAREQIDRLMNSNDVAAIQSAIARLGASVEKIHLLDRLDKLKSGS